MSKFRTRIRDIGRAPGGIGFAAITRRERPRYMLAQRCVPRLAPEKHDLLHRLIRKRRPVVPQACAQVVGQDLQRLLQRGSGTFQIRGVVGDVGDLRLGGGGGNS